MTLITQYQSLGAKTSLSTTFVFYELFWGMFWKSFEVNSPIKDKVYNDTAVGTDTKSIPMWGGTEANEFSYGENVLVPGTTDNSFKLLTLTKKKFPVQADLPVTARAFIPDVDRFWSPDGAQEQAIVAQRLASALGRAHELRLRSALIQTSSLGDSITPSATMLTKAQAGTLAGLADAAGAYDGRGIHVNANIAVSASAVEDTFWQADAYFNALGVNKLGRVALVSPDVYRLLPMAAASPNANFAGTAQTDPSQSFSTELRGTTGDYSTGIIPTLANFEVMNDPFLYTLGTKIKGLPWGSAGLTANNAAGNDKYAPGSTTLAGATAPGTPNAFNSAAYGQLNIGGTAATNWNSSNGGAINVAKWYDNTKIIFFQTEGLGVIWNKMPGAEQDRKIEAMGNLIVSSYIAGIGPLRSEAILHVVTAIPTVGQQI